MPSNNLWETRFETELKKDKVAELMLRRAQGRGISRRRLLLLLEAVADPNIERRLQHFCARYSGEGFWFPTRADARHLSRKLKDTAVEIEKFWCHSMFSLLAYSQEATQMAKELERQAHILKGIRWSVVTRQTAYKTLWRQIPVVLLCLETRAPKQIPYDDLSQLVGAALRAHGQPDTSRAFTPAAIRRKYQRFRKRHFASGGFALVEALLKLLLPPD